MYALDVYFQNLKRVDSTVLLKAPIALGLRLYHGRG